MGGSSSSSASCSSSPPRPSTPPPSKPDIVSVFADKQVKEGQDGTLSCEASTGDVTVKWEKNGRSLECVMDKHIKRQIGKTFSLTIKDTTKEDEGNYTINLSNRSGSASCSAMVIVELNEWRTVQWKPDPMLETLKTFKVSNSEVKELRFLLNGPVGAGKSSIINTIKTIFQGYQSINCLVASELGSTSFTTKYQKFPVESRPFALYDVMGLENDQVKNAGQGTEEFKLLKGVHSDDIINALKGHIPNDYEFKPEQPMSEDNRYYISDPTLNDKIHCLVSVIAADKITFMDNDVIQKIKTIRAEASKLGIPQLVFMTRVDNVCMLTKENLAKIYQSKKIKEKMEECSTRLGVPMNCIFPLKNYHEETKQNEKLNCLALEAFTQAVYSANDYVKKFSRKDKCVE
uniref:Ig-like domain-containing protein n=1 Tax=Pygocentrus nattereri TaxID=42514 RepID=A0A3B4ENE1_PYGNA